MCARHNLTIFISSCIPFSLVRKWKTEFEKLYSGSENSVFDNAVKAELLQSKHSTALPECATNLNRPINYQEVKDAVLQSKLQKACGIDKITNELLKSDEVVELLHALFTNCFTSGLIPDAWRKSVINPIPKSDGYSTDPLKYRGLSLQSCVYKIFSVILNRRVMAYLENSHNLEEEQNGFRRNRSCLHHIFVLQCLIRNKCETGNKILSCFVDFHKAFDSINRDLLFHQLSETGVTGPILSLIKQMYRNTMNTVRVNDLCTEEFESKLGSKQGDPSSPTHFNIYINGLLKKLKSSGLGISIDGGDKVCVLAYADDVVLLAETEHDLQALMNIVGEWCRTWRLSINPTKTNVIHFRPKNTLVSTEEFWIDQYRIGTVEKYKYLGVTLTSNGQTDYIVDQLAGAASRALGVVISKCKDNFDLGYQSFTRLFKSCVVPILDFASGSWSTGSSNVSQIDKVQMRASRFFCGLTKSTVNMGVIGEIGWSPGVVRRDLESLRLYNQIIQMENSCLPKRILLYDKKTNGIWSRNLLSICQAIDRSQSWVDGSVVNLRFAKERLMRMYSDTWAAEMELRPKLENYSAIKSDWCVSPHVKANLTKAKRSLICRLMCGSLQLGIETG